MPKQSSESARTSTLLRQLFKAPSLDSFFEDNEQAFQTPSFREYLSQLCEEHGVRREHAIRRSGIERAYGYQLFNGTRKPSRDKVLQIALALRLEVDETQKLLQVAEKSPLYPRIKRDAAVLYCLSHEKGVMETQMLLSDLGLRLLDQGV